MYGILMMAGAVVAILIAVFRRRNDNIPKTDMFFCSLFAFVFGIAGAKVFAIVGNLNYVVSGQLSIVDLLKSGFVFYGGFIGGVLGALWYIKKFKFKPLVMFDALVVGLPLAHAIGRVGCFCSGCCFGKPTDSIIGVVFTHPLDPYTPVGVKIYPTQLLEAACLLVIFVIVAIMASKKVRAGVLTVTYCLLYAIARFVIEFFRGDIWRIFNDTITASQIIAVLVILVVIGLGILYMRRKRQNPLLYSTYADNVYAAFSDIDANCEKS